MSLFNIILVKPKNRRCGLCDQEQKWFDVLGPFRLYARSKGFILGAPFTVVNKLIKSCATLDEPFYLCKNPCWKDFEVSLLKYPIPYIWILVNVPPGPPKAEDFEIPPFLYE